MSSNDIFEHMQNIYNLLYQMKIAKGNRNYATK